MTSMKSRLSSTVLFYFTGGVRSPGFSASFRPIIVKIVRRHLLKTMPRGWYRIEKRVRNTYVSIRSADDVTLLQYSDIRGVATRMKIRFAKLLNRVKATRRRKVGDVYLVPMEDALIVSDADYIVYVVVGELISIDVLSRSMFMTVVRGSEREQVVVCPAKSGPRFMAVFRFVP